MMKKEVKVKRNIWNSIEGACGINKGKETAEEGGEILMRDAKVKWLKKQVGQNLGLDPGK